MSDRIEKIREKYSFHSKLELCKCDGCFLLSTIDTLRIDSERLTKENKINIQQIDISEKIETDDIRQVISMAKKIQKLQDENTTMKEAIEPIIEDFDLWQPNPPGSGVEISWNKLCKLKEAGKEKEK